MFQAETENGTQLFTMKPDGTDMRQVTDVEPVPQPDPFLQSPGASRPGWSPDGSTIVFAENDCTIAFIAADGSDLRRVTREPTASASSVICEGAPAFMPDGLEIVYERCEGMTCEFWAAEMDGTNRRRSLAAAAPRPQCHPMGRGSPPKAARASGWPTWTGRMQGR